jgi:hypothetical protein
MKNQNKALIDKTTRAFVFQKKKDCENEDFIRIS